VIINDDDKVITHFGIRGMKWGIRKDKNSSSSNEALRLKAKSVVKRQRELSSSTGADLKFADWMSKTTSQKAVAQLPNVASSVAIGYVISNALGIKFNKRILASAVIRGVRNAAIGTAVKEYAGRRVLKRYTDSGDRDKTKKQYKRLTPEVAISIGVATGVALAPIAGRVATAGLKSAVINKRKNEAAFNKWGANILDKKTSEFHTIYDDGYMSILEKIGG